MKRRAILFGLAFVLVACAGAPVAQPEPTEAAKAAPAPWRWKVSGAGAHTLVLVHGNFDRLETWSRVLPRLEKSFRVVTLDLPGYGESPAAPKPDFETMTGAVLAVMDAAGVEKAVIVGNSMGGAVAAGFAAAHPERVEGLVLEDANYSMVGPNVAMLKRIFPMFHAAKDWKADPSNPELAAKTRAAVAHALELALPTPGALDDALIDHFTRGFDAKHLPVLEQVQSEFRYGDLGKALTAARSKVSFPVLVIWGGRDPLIPLEGAERILASLPDARLVLVEECGHATHLERPETFATILESAFGPQGSFPADHRCIADPSSPPPPLDLASRRIAQIRLAPAVERKDPGALADLALLQLRNDEVEAAARTVAELPATAPAPARATAAYVRAILQELEGKPAVAATLIDAAKDWDGRLPPLPLLRVVRMEMTAEQRAQVAPLAAAMTAGELPGALARIDLALAEARYDDAWDELELIALRWPTILLRRSMALAGRGYLEQALAENQAAFNAIAGEIRRGSATEAFLNNEAGCASWSKAWIQAGMGQRGEEVFRCSMNVVRASQEFTSVPPHQGVAGQFEYVSALFPAALQKPDAARAELAPLAKAAPGAVALARLELRLGRVKEAIAALKAAAPDSAAQFAPYWELLLPLRASTGDRSAVKDAKALSARHPGDAAWLHVLGVTQLAAGNYKDANSTLLMACVLAPQERHWLFDLALVQAALGDIGLAKGFADKATKPERDIHIAYAPYAKALWEKFEAPFKAASPVGKAD